jgi:hypothetical protein
MGFVGKTNFFIKGLIKNKKKFDNYNLNLKYYL